MTREEAIERIRDHMIVHEMNEPRAIYISEALSMAIEALEQEAVRNATLEERESIDKYIKSISKSTGVDFWDLEQEPMREFTEEETKAYSKTLDKMYKPMGFNVFNEPCGDAISRQAVINAIANTCFWLSSDNWEELMKCINSIPPVNPQEPKTDYKAFAEWVATEIFDDMWEYNKDAFAEIACRKLAKLGIVRENGNQWELIESQENEVSE